MSTDALRHAEAASAVTAPEATASAVTAPEATASAVALRDGTAIKVRPVRCADRDRLRAFLGGVSTQALFMRFFGVPCLDRTADALAAVGPSLYGLVVQAPGGSEIIAHGAWFRTGPDRAEVAFLVTDAWQGRGIGRLLFRRLAEVARHRGIAALTAEVMPSNRRMVSIFEFSGYAAEVRTGPDAYRVRIATDGYTADVARAA
jgi:GNAT superfamily N-acetyltransferase